MPIEILQTLYRIEVEIEMIDSNKLQIRQIFKFVIAEIKYLQEGE